MKKKAIDKMPLNVLYLEDSLQDIEIIRELLIDAGYDLRMDCTEKKKEFTSLLRRNTYDVILSDFKLPGFDAFGALQLCTELRPNIPFICISGSIGEEIAIELIKKGATDYVLKDRLVRLPSAIQRALDEVKEKRARCQAEEDLNESEQRFRHLFMSSPDAVMLLDPSDPIVDWPIVDCNEIACRMNGYTRSELIGESIDILNVSKGTPEERAHYLKKIKRRGVLHLESFHRHRDGHIFPIEVSTSIITFKGRELVLGIDRDIADRKQAEEALRESEYFFKESQRTANIGSYKTDFIAGMWESSKVLDRIFGIDQNYNRNIQGWLEIVHPDDMSMMDQYLREEVILKRKPFDKEYRIIRKSDRKTRWVHGLGKVDFDTAGNVISMIGTIQDITERKQAEEKSSHLAAIVESSSDAIIGKTLDGNIISWNKSAERIYGYQEAEIIGQPISLLVPPGREDEVPQILERIKRGEFVDHYETVRQRKDGQLISIAITISPVKDAGGKIVSASVIARDITENKRMGEALRESEERLRLILDATKIGVWDWDLKKNIQYVSPTTYSMLGYKEGENTHDPILWLDRIHPEDRQTVEETTKKALSDPTENYQYTVRMKHADGSYRWIEVQGYVMEEDAAGNPTRLSGIRMDITARKRAEEALKESQSLYYSFLEQLPNAVFRKDREGRYVLVNSQFCKLKSLTKEDFIGRKPVEVAAREKEKQGEQGHATKYASFGEDAHGLILRTGKILESEEEYPMKDGGTQFMHVVRMPIFDSHGTAIGTQGIMFDITERKRAEEALRERERQISLIYDTVGDNIYNLKVEKDGTYRFTSVNRCFLSTTGLRAEQVIGKKVQDVIPEPSLTFVLEKYAEAIRQKKIVRWEETSEYPSGQVTGEVSVAPVYDYTMNCISLVGSVHDMTDRKRMEEALAASEIKYRSFFENSMDAILLTGPVGEILSANPAACKMFGYSEDELITMGRSGIVDVTDPKLSPLLAERKLYGKAQGEISFIRKDGTHFPAEISSALFKSSRGEIQTSMIIRDITERKRAEEEVRESEERFRMVFENVFDGISIYSENPDPLKRKLIECNEQYAAMAGRSRAELLQLGSTLGLQKTLDNKSNEHRLESLTRKTAFQGSFSWIRPDGRENIIEYMGMPITWRGESYSIGIDRDITERKKAEEALRESEATLSDAMRIANLATWEYDVAKDEFTFNDQFYALFHTTAEREGGYNKSSMSYAQKFVYPDDMAMVGVEIQKALQTDDPNYYSRLDHRMIYGDGEMGYITVHIRIEKDTQGRTIKTHGVNQDITERKRAEAEQARLLQILESSLNEIYVFDSVNLVFEYANKGALRNLGYTIEVMQSMTPLDLKPEFTEVSFRQTIAPLLRHEKEILVFTTVHRRADGSLYPVEVHLQLVELEHQRLFLAVIQDITERKQAEEALRASEEKFHTIFNNVQDVYYETSMDGTIVEVSPSIEIMSNGQYKREDLIGHSMAEFYCIAEERQAFLKLLKDHGSVSDFEITLQNRDGSLIPCSISSKIFYHTHDLSQVILGSMREITKRKEAEEALRASELLFKTLTETAPVGIFRTDVQGVTNYVNPQWSTISKIHFDKALGDGWLDAVHPDDRAQLISGWQQATKNQTDSKAEYRFVHPDGSIAWVSGQAVPQKDEKGTVVGYIGTAMDITERKHAESKLRSTLEEKEVLLREVHHRVKNNLQAIISLMQMRMKDITDTETLQFMAELETQARTMALVYEQLYQSENLANVAMLPYIQKLSTYVMEGFGSGRTVEIALDIEDLHFDVTYAIPCGLIINELLTNSLKYAFPPSFTGVEKVTLGMHIAGDVCTLIAADNGIGLPAGLDLSTSKSIGLRLVNLWATHQLGGTLKVNNDKGTTYTVTFTILKEKD